MSTPLEHPDHADDGPVAHELAALRDDASPGPAFVAGVMREIERTPTGLWDRLRAWRPASLRRALVALPIAAVCASMWLMVASAERQKRRIDDTWSADVPEPREVTRREPRRR